MSLSPALLRSLILDPLFVPFTIFILSPVQRSYICHRSPRPRLASSLLAPHGLGTLALQPHTITCACRKGPCERRRRKSRLCSWYCQESHRPKASDSARIYAVQCSLHAARMMRTSTSHYPKKYEYATNTLQAGCSTVGRSVRFGSITIQCPRRRRMFDGRDRRACPLRVRSMNRSGRVGSGSTFSETRVGSGFGLGGFFGSGQNLPPLIE